MDETSTSNSQKVLSGTILLTLKDAKEAVRDSEAQKHAVQSAVDVVVRVAPVHPPNPADVVANPCIGKAVAVCLVRSSKFRSVIKPIPNQTFSVPV